MFGLDMERWKYFIWLPLSIVQTKWLSNILFYALNLNWIWCTSNTVFFEVANKFSQKWYTEKHKSISTSPENDNNLLDQCKIRTITTYILIFIYDINSLSCQLGFLPTFVVNCEVIKQCTNTESVPSRVKPEVSSLPGYTSPISGVKSDEKINRDCLTLVLPSSGSYLDILEVAWRLQITSGDFIE